MQEASREQAMILRRLLVRCQFLPSGSEESFKSHPEAFPEPYQTLQTTLKAVSLL
jgi:hypothetical protein